MARLSRPIAKDILRSSLNSASYLKFKENIYVVTFVNKRKRYSSVDKKKKKKKDIVVNHVALLEALQ